MKAISLWQPWASAIAVGLKAIETRSWPTAYRGPIAIHAAKRWTNDEREFLQDFKEVWPDEWRRLPAALPFGCIVATGILYAIDAIDREYVTTDLENALGNFTPGRFAWVLTNVSTLARPIPFRGAQGLFDVPDSLLTVKPEPIFQ